ncbi:MAG: hypothetical protein WC389_10045 [Lutibacter sp.]|jgi:hypothetical protein
MILHFMRHFPNGEKTHFIEKIWVGFAWNDALYKEYEWAVEAMKEHWPYSDDACDANGSIALFIDGRHINAPDELLTIAQNDGFTDVNHFFEFFNKPQQLKIIHWTQLKY